MRYEVVNERSPEKHLGIFTVNVRKWHTFMSGSECTKEFLAMSHSKTEDGKLEVYEAIERPSQKPAFVRMSKREQDRLWKAVKAYREEETLREVEDTVSQKYGEYFTALATSMWAWRVWRPTVHKATGNDSKITRKTDLRSA